MGLLRSLVRGVDVRLNWGQEFGAINSSYY